MIETNMTAKFQQEIVNFLKENINYFKGRKIYGGDLCHELTMDENNNGAWEIYTEKANAFVKKFRKDARDTIEYYNSNFGEDFLADKLGLEPYDLYSKRIIKLIIDSGNSSLFTFFMLYYGVDEIVPQLSCVSENWDEAVLIDQDFIDTFIAELEEQ